MEGIPRTMDSFTLVPLTDNAEAMNSRMSNARKLSEAEKPNFVKSMARENSEIQNEIEDEIQTPEEGSDRIDRNDIEQTDEWAENMIINKILEVI